MDSTSKIKPRRVLAVFLQGRVMPPCLDQLKLSLAKHETIRLACVESAQEATFQLVTAGMGIVFFSITHKDDVVSIMKFLNLHKKNIREGVVRPMAFIGLNHPKLPELLKNKGCRDLFEMSLTAKALLLKLEQTVQIIDKTSEKAAKAEEKSALRAENGKEPPKSVAQNREAAKSVKWAPAVTVQSDCWLIASKKDARCIMGRWLIDMMGPSPAAGSWVEGKEPDLWIWEQKAPGQNPFILEAGAWIFKGRQPEFIWKKNRWQFISNEPRLCFVYEGNSYAERFQFEEPRTLVIAENSAAAQAKAAKMAETFDTELRMNQPISAEDQGPFRIEEEEEPQTKELSITLEEPATQNWNLHDFEKEMALARADGLGTDLPSAEENEFDLFFAGLPVAWKVGAEGFIPAIDLTVEMKPASEKQERTKVTFLENNEKELFFHGPVGVVKSGQSVVFDFLVEFYPQKIQFEITGTVESADGIDESGALICVLLNEDYQGGLNFLANLYARQQHQVNDFFDEATGRS